MRFRDWSIRTKLFAACAAMLMTLAAFGGWSAMHLWKLYGGVGLLSNFEQNIQYVKDAALLDRTLTGTLRVYVSNPSASVGERYAEISGKLKALLASQLQKHQGSNLEVLARRARDSRDALTVLEYEIQQRAEAGEAEAALRMFSSELYVAEQKVYADALADYVGLAEGLLHDAVAAHDAQLGYTLRVALYFSLAFAFMSILVTSMAANYFLRSLRSLHRVITAICRGDFSERAMVESRDEFGELGIAFNKFVLSVEQAALKSENFAKRLKQITKEVGQ